MTTPANNGNVRFYSPRVLTAGQIDMADRIIEAATGAGLNPSFMIALAVTESSLNPKAIGDDGISMGLFQLNKRFITATDTELLDADFNIDAAMEKMRLLIRSFPGHTFGDYAEAWTLGGTGRFRRMRRNPGKLAAMERAISDLRLTLSLREIP